jgi:hypothetical protein
MKMGTYRGARGVRQNNKEESRRIGIYYIE